jgi:cytochrome c-type biogenesis protein CcmH
MRRALPIFLLLVLLLPAAARAVEPDEILDDPKLEHRAREISLGLRCLVCQNQSIDDSNAPLAKDLRILVRERLKAGDSDAEVVDYIVARYGEFVLLRPRFDWHTLILWFGPLALLLGAMWLVYRAYTRRLRESEGAAPKALSAAEKRKLKKLLHDG